MLGLKHGSFARTSALNHFKIFKLEQILTERREGDGAEEQGHTLPSARTRASLGLTSDRIHLRTLSDISNIHRLSTQDTLASHGTKWQ